MDMKTAISSALFTLCVAALPACQTAPEFPGAPPAVVEDCRRQVVVMTERDPGSPGDPPLPERTGEPDEGVIDEARAGRAEARARNLAAWPEEVLLYRCLAARGVELSTEQARELAEWESRLEED